MLAKAVARCVGALALVPLFAPAFTVDDQPSNVTVVQGGLVTVVQSSTDFFSLSSVPVGPPLEFFFVLPAEFATVQPTPNTGEPLTHEQVLFALEGYFRRHAIDFESLRLRSVEVRDRGFITWCSNPSIFGCLNRELRAGTRVDFEVNGRNRQGGMTGFAPRIFMIRRVPSQAASNPAPAPASTEATAPQ